MIESDRSRFATALLATFEIYSKELSEMVVKVWWAALKPYPVDAVCSALTKHIADQERGQYAPKPADVIRFLTTGEKEQLENLKGKAEMQWLRVLQAIKECGAHRTPKFKDPVTGAVIASIGWPFICQKKEDQLNWVQKEFVSTYLEFEKRPLKELPNNIAGIADLQRHKLENKSGLEALEKGLADYEARKQA